MVELSDNPGNGDKIAEKSRFNEINMAKAKLDSLSDQDFLDDDKIQQIIDTAVKLKKLDEQAYDEYVPKIIKYVDKAIDRLKYRSARSLRQFNIALKRLYLLSDFNLPNHDKPLKIFQEIEENLRKYLEANPEIAKNYLQTRISTLLRHEDIKGNFADMLQTALINKDLESLRLVDNNIVNEEGIYKKIFQGKKWTLNMFSKETDIIIVASEENPRICIAITWQDISQILENKRFDLLAHEAEANFKQEATQKEDLGSFDLPKDQSIAYFRVFPAVYDPVVSN